METSDIISRQGMQRQHLTPTRTHVLASVWSGLLWGVGWDGRCGKPMFPPTAPRGDGLTLRSRARRCPGGRGRATQTHASEQPGPPHARWETFRVRRRAHGQQRPFHTRKFCCLGRDRTGGALASRWVPAILSPRRLTRSREESPTRLSDGAFPVGPGDALERQSPSPRRVPEFLGRTCCLRGRARTERTCACPHHTSDSESELLTHPTRHPEPACAPEALPHCGPEPCFPTPPPGCSGRNGRPVAAGPAALRDGRALKTR